VNTPEKTKPNPTSLVGAPPEFVTRMIGMLTESDPQFRAALPKPEINEIKQRKDYCLAQIVNACMEGYADRPALAQRAIQRTTDPETGRQVLQLQDRFETISYGDLWSRARALASFWHHESDRHLRLNEFVSVIAFAGIDFVTVQLAAIYNGAVTVPLQTNGQKQQLLGIVKEAEPRWLATSLECLETAVELVLEGHQPKGLLLFDYDPEVDDHREAYARAQTRLDNAGLQDFIVTLTEACRQGGALPPHRCSPRRRATTG
jgi:fatty acid CoA ligase FadD9